MKIIDRASDLQSAENWPSGPLLTGFNPSPSRPFIFGSAPRLREFVWSSLGDPGPNTSPPPLYSSFTSGPRLQNIGRGSLGDLPQGVSHFKDGVLRQLSRRAPEPPDQ